MAIGRLRDRRLSDSQVELLKTFAEQAVIAIGSAETYRELQARTAELTDALETQSATADVLKAISRAAYDLDTVLTMLITTALRLCNSAHGQIWRRDGEIYRYVASLGNVPAYREIEEHTEIRAGRGTLVGRVAMEGRTVQIADAWNDPDYADKVAARMGQARSMLGVPLLRDGEMIGAFALARKDLVPYTDREVELVTTFADQAVIAIENVRLFDEVQARTAALARSVAELQALEEVLRAVNSSLDLETVLATIISRAVQLSQADEGTIYEFDDVEQVFVPKAAFGMSSERVEALRERKVRVGETHLGRAAVLRAPVAYRRRAAGHDARRVGWLLQGIHAVLAVPLLRDDKVIGGLVIRRRTAGGFAPTIPTLLQTFAGQSVLAIENARLFQEARRARTAAEATLADLRRAQDRLVQSEKMASLGQLTAGIAHEIKNPLNFVNNFSDLSVDLLDELHDAVAPDKLAIAADLRAEIDELTATLKGNLEKIAQHGRRADSIVKNMLLHSRSGPSEHRAIDLNTTVEEALNLAYHGARAETPGFNITMEKELDPAAGAVDLFPQEFTRVMLNLIGNGFYAARRRAEQTADQAFEPTLRLTTRDLGEQVEIRVRDNGTGISDSGAGQDLRTVLHHKAGRRRHRARPVAQLRYRRQTTRRTIGRGQPDRCIHRIHHYTSPTDDDGRRRHPMTVRVLVVDDEPDVETLFRQQFRREVRQGLYVLDFALSGAAALETLEGCVGEQIILLVSDINMPGMTGLELLPVVKERRPDLPVFMISAYGDAGTVATALERGAKKFLTKPVDFPQLKQDVMAVMAQARGSG